MQAFIMELIKDGSLFRGVLATVLTVVMCYLVIVSAPIPDFFSIVYGVVIGYFFGTNTIANVQNKAQLVKELP